MNNSKRIFRLFFIISAFFIVGCASVPKPVVFILDESLRIIYTRQIDCSLKNKISVKVDMTFYADNQGLAQNSIINYTVFIKDLSTKEISAAKFSLKVGDELFPLQLDRILSKERVNKNHSEVRFSSLISVEDSQKLLDLSTENVYFCVEYDNQVYEIEAKKLKSRIEEVSNMV